MKIYMNTYGPVENHFDYIHSGNGSEFSAQLVSHWLVELKAKTLYIESGSPWENGYNESFHGKLRDEFLNGEIL